MRFLLEPCFTVLKYHGMKRSKDPLFIIIMILLEAGECSVKSFTQKLLRTQVYGPLLIWSGCLGQLAEIPSGKAGMNGLSGRNDIVHELARNESREGCADHSTSVQRVLCSRQSNCHRSHHRICLCRGRSQRRACRGPRCCRVQSLLRAACPRVENPLFYTITENVTRAA